jgi:FKBP-type peptidyl-prolyl cis-trans isomerase FkpA
MASVLGLTLAACGRGAAAPGTSAMPAEPTVETTTFDAKLDVDLAKYTRSRSGLYWSDLITGTGTAAAVGRKVSMRYVVSLPDAKVVEVQRDPIEAEIGSSMIRGMREGLQGMRAGGVRRLIVPPALGYGRRAYGNIPPNAVLVFEVEVVAVR